MMMMMMLCRTLRSSLVLRREHDVSPVGRLLRAHELVDRQVGGDRRTLEMSEDDDAHQIPSTHARTVYTQLDRHRPQTPPPLLPPGKSI